MSAPAVPPPPAPFNPLTEEWPPGRLLARVDLLDRLPISFNSTAGSGRFRPIRDAAGAVVPTMYAADGFDGALSETVFHDLPATAEPKHLARSLLVPRGFARLQGTRSLRLVQLRGHGLRRLGATHGQLVETGPSSYAATAAWGQAAYDHPDGLDGLIWISRQFPGGLAVMLFGDRCADALEPLDEPPLPLAYGRGFELVCAAANEARVIIVEA